MRRRSEVKAAVEDGRKGTENPPEEPEAPKADPEPEEPAKRQEPAKKRKRRKAAAKAPEGPPDFVCERAVAASIDESCKALGDAAAAEVGAKDMDDRLSMLDQRRQAMAKELENLVLSEGTGKIVKRIFEIDIWACYERLETELKIGSPGNHDRRTLVIALDAAQDNARQAHAIYASAKVAVDRYDMDAEVLSVSMREQATAELTAEKARGERPKAITDADVTSKIAALFPDEWITLTEHRARAKRTVAHLERFSDLWKARARNLEVLLESARV